MRLNTKLMVIILASTVIIYSTAVTYLSYHLRTISRENITSLADSYAKEYASDIKSEFNLDIGISRTLAYTFTDNWDLDYNNKFNLYQNIIENNLRYTQEYSVIWTSFELNTFGEYYNKDFGRLRCEAYSDKGILTYRADSINLDGDVIGGNYYNIKLSKLEAIDEPYMYSKDKLKENEVLTTSICIPIVKNNKFQGLSGVDFELDRTQKIVDRINIFNENGIGYLIGYNGKYVSNPNKDLYNTSFAIAEPKISEKYKVVDKIQKGEAFSFTDKNQAGEKLYYTFAPIYIGKTITPWSLAITVPIHVIMKESNRVFIISILVGFLGLLIITLITWRISRNISIPLIKTTEILQKLDKGIIDEESKIYLKSRDEVEDMAVSVNNLIDSLNKTADFAKEVGKGNLNAEFTLLSNEDMLGNALLDMRNSLISAKEDDIRRKKEESIINWNSDGLARFSEILRYNVEDMGQFGYSIISNLAKYMDTNQGGIFLINNDDQRDEYIEVIALYAYDKEKYSDKRIEMGDGLIGQCILEKETIYLTEITKDYVPITSGLGKSNANSLLLVPLKFNDEVYGAIQIASFNPIDNYRINFVEKIAENIASTISTIKINIRTKKLLEESREKSEKMSMQEEEIRQNMEEMQATQEEMSRTITDLEEKQKKLIETLESKDKELKKLLKKK